MATEEVTFKYSKICADDSGETHFKDEEVDLTEKNYAPPAPPVWVGPKGTATGVLVLVFPPGWYGDWHPAPQRQFMFHLTGQIESRVSDGEVRNFVPGDILLLEDTTGKGHISRVIGSTKVINAVVTLPD